MRFVCLVALLAGCGVANFDIEEPVPEQRVTGSPLPGPLAVLFPLPLSIDLSSKIKAMETGPIDSVTLSKLTLSITATAMTGTDMDDWSFVDEIHVFVKSNKSGSTLPRIEIANISHPGAVKTLEFHCDSSVDINPYVNEGSVVEGESSGRLPEDDVTYNGEGVFTVHPL
ncbi:MAG TPA: hypothetical protein VMZ53_31255 [Kofleriaceae bacterium]|nr:hypothetical protein [Kofleriaceae bacterium]